MDTSLDSMIDSEERGYEPPVFKMLSKNDRTMIPQGSACVKCENANWFLVESVEPGSRLRCFCRLMYHSTYGGEFIGVIPVCDGQIKGRD